MANPRIGADLIDYLSKNYPPRCIGPSESTEQAHRYAGQVELAQKLIRMAKKDEDSIIEVQED